MARQTVDRVVTFAARIAGVSKEENLRRIREEAWLKKRRRQVEKARREELLRRILQETRLKKRRLVERVQRWCQGIASCVDP